MRRTEYLLNALGQGCKQLNVKQFEKFANEINSRVCAATLCATHEMP